MVLPNEFMPFNLDIYRIANITTLFAFTHIQAHRNLTGCFIGGLERRIPLPGYMQLGNVWKNKIIDINKTLRSAAAMRTHPALPVVLHHSHRNSPHGKAKAIHYPLKSAGWNINPLIPPDRLWRPSGLIGSDTLTADFANCYIHSP